MGRLCWINHLGKERGRGVELLPPMPLRLGHHPPFLSSQWMEIFWLVQQALSGSLGATVQKTLVAHSQKLEDDFDFVGSYMPGPLNTHRNLMVSLQLYSLSDCLWLHMKQWPGAATSAGESWSSWCILGGAAAGARVPTQRWGLYLQRASEINALVWDLSP